VTTEQAARDVLHARLIDAARRIKQCDGSEVVCVSCRHEINDVMEAADAYAAAQQPQSPPELATLRALHRVAGYFADTWAELMAALPDDYGCEMNCAEANAAADLYRALGLDAGAAAIIAAHVEHDDDEERATHGEGWIDEPLNAAAPELADQQWTVAELAAALDSFYAWFTVTGGGARVQGQLLGADAEEFARALHAQLGAHRAHREPEDGK
jgi:hypothetical protein